MINVSPAPSAFRPSYDWLLNVVSVVEEVHTE